MAKEASLSQFVDAWNDLQTYPTLEAVAKACGISLKTARNKVGFLRTLAKSDPNAPTLIHRPLTTTPLSEDLSKITDDWTAEQCIAELRRVAEAEPERVITRNYFRVHGRIAESVWSRHFGVFDEFKRQANIVLSRQQHMLEKQIAKHASVDHYRDMNVERASYEGRYERPADRRFQTILVCSDLHDRLVDPFYLRVLLDTARRVQPEVIVFNGDIWDAAEFGKYTVDPRAFDVVGKIRFIHENILRPLREACPAAQIDWISGNHEDRLVKHLADATPAMKILLSDLHGFTVGKLLGLDEFQINFIAKSDLGAYTATNIKSEVAKNYKVYFGCFATNHFPEGVRLGLPGTNGHSHKFKVTPCYNEIFGSYSWIQTGCGHVKDASYCDADAWDMGFLLAHVDAEKKLVNQEYIAITDFAVAGGKFYHRDSAEWIHVPA